MNFESISNKVMSYIKGAQVDFKGLITKLSTETIGWIGILLCHAATIPTLLGLMFGLTDNPPPIDMVLIVWGALGMFFMKAIIQRDILNLITIGLGFIMQATLMALIFFK
jgi:hypothetical protein